MKLAIDDILAEIEAVYEAARAGKMDWKHAESAAAILSALGRLRLNSERRPPIERRSKTAEVPKPAAPIVLYDGESAADLERARAQALREAAGSGAEAIVLLPEKHRILTPPDHG